MPLLPDSGGRGGGWAAHRHRECELRGICSVLRALAGGDADLFAASFWNVERDDGRGSGRPGVDTERGAEKVRSAVRIPDAAHDDGAAESGKRRASLFSLSCGILPDPAQRNQAQVSGERGERVGYFPERHGGGGESGG